MDALLCFKVKSNNIGEFLHAINSLTYDPGIVTPIAAINALTVLDKCSNNDLSPDIGSRAINSISDVLESQVNNKNTGLVSEDQQKEISTNIMRVSRKIMEAIQSDGGEVAVDTPLIKAVRTPVNGKKIDISSADGSGVTIEPNVLERLNQNNGEDIILIMISYSINT